MARREAIADAVDTLALLADRLADLSGDDARAAFDILSGSDLNAKAAYWRAVFKQDLRARAPK